MKMRCVICAFICALTGCSVSDVPLVGPCSAFKRAAPDKAYYQLALSMVFARIDQRFGSWDATPERVAAQLAKLDSLRADWLPTVDDECLRAHASDWISFYEKRARNALADKARNAGYHDDYERERAEEADQKRALAARLGVRP